MELFISYAHKNTKRVSTLAATFNRLRHNVNFDQRLTGGDVWWAQILMWIEACDVFVFALSPESLTSDACRAEVEYACALNKPILPLLIAPIVRDGLPPVLRDRQYEDMRRLLRRWKGRELSERIAGALTELDDKIDGGLFPPADPPPHRPPFPFPDKQPAIITQSPAITVASVIQKTIGRFPNRAQLWLFAILYLVLIALGQVTVWGMDALSNQVQHTALNELMMVSIVWFAGLGFRRGWTRELLAMAGLMLILFAVHQFEWWIAGQAYSDEQRFIVLATIIATGAFFAFQYGPTVLAPRQYRGRDRVFVPRRADVQDGVLGSLAGAMNGYLLAGSLWYYLDKYDYPLSYFRVPLPTDASARWIDSLPQAWLLGGDGNLFAVMVIAVFIFVVVTII